MDREEFSSLLGAVKEIASAVKRIEDRIDHMEGRLTRMEERQTRMESDLLEFRRENRDQLAKMARRLDHHDLMLMDHNRRLMEAEHKADS